MNQPPAPNTFSPIRRALDAGADALRFFTRAPVPARWGSHERFFDGAAAAAPLAGLVIGAGAALALALASLAGLPPAVAATLAAAVAVALSGALHLDGLADVADGFGGGRTRDAKLAVMRDSRNGTYGTAAIALALIARVALVSALAERLGPGGAAAGLMAAAALARPLAFLPTRMLAPARADGLGHAARPKSASVAFGTALGIVAALLLAGLGSGLIAAAIAGLAAGGVALLSRAQIGGYTGDVCGAAAEVAELAALAAIVALAAPA